MILLSRLTQSWITVMKHLLATRQTTMISIVIKSQRCVCLRRSLNCLWLSFCCQHSCDRADAKLTKWEITHIAFIKNGLFVWSLLVWCLVSLSSLSSLISNDAWLELKLVEWCRASWLTSDQISVASDYPFNSMVMPAHRYPLSSTIYHCNYHWQWQNHWHPFKS